MNTPLKTHKIKNPKIHHQKPFENHPPKRHQIPHLASIKQAYARQQTNTYPPTPNKIELLMPH